MNLSRNVPINKPNRQDRLIKEENHDPYMLRGKPSEPTACPECGVVFNDGRWQWLSATPPNAQQEVCPACQRIRDQQPAGILTLSGDFFHAHREEMLNLIHNKVDGQKSAHPMKRIMAIDEQEGGSTVITFTDTHLPRGVGQAIESAYNGELEIQYTEETNLVRVYWQR